MDYYYFFGGYCSQWYDCEFTYNDIQYSSTEKWMMAMKALCMHDYDSYHSILKSNDPKYIKQLGRQVKNYDDTKWSKERYEVVVLGNYLKFSQDRKLKKWLLSTRHIQLVEASPTDTIWGIGLSVYDAERGLAWRGDNLLGKAIMEVREKLKNEANKY
jgi:ribA/ribD-fused uncharacterized protein